MSTKLRGGREGEAVRSLENNSCRAAGRLPQIRANNSLIKDHTYVSSLCSAVSANAIRLSEASFGFLRLRLGPKTSLKGCVASRLLRSCRGKGQD